MWLGNNRGSRYSTEHSIFHKDSKKYWDFSIDHLAVYDIPAMIQFIQSTRLAEDAARIHNTKASNSPSSPPSYSSRQGTSAPVPVPPVVALAVATVTEVGLADAFMAAARDDAAYCQLVSAPPPNTVVRDGVLWDASERMYVPNDDALRTRILAHCHH